MALFFDRQWFEEKLAERGLNPRIMAAAAGMSEAELALAFKDQRELSAEEVGIFADLLGVPTGQALLHITRVGYLESGLPVELTHSYCRSDLYGFVSEIRRER